jgi:hypothetical protein
MTAVEAYARKTIPVNEHCSIKAPNCNRLCHAINVNLIPVYFTPELVLTVSILRTVVRKVVKGI